MIDLSTDPMAAIRKRQQHDFETENYVSSPPALWVVDETGACWTLGFNPDRDGPRGEFSFDVLRDGIWTGVSASRIERRGGRIRCFCRDGWKIWRGTSFY